MNPLEGILEEIARSRREFAQRLIIVVKGPTRESTLVYSILALTGFGWTKPFALAPCKSLLPQDLSSSFASAKPTFPFQECVMFFHSHLLLHILYCFFHLQVLWMWVPFYVLSFQALVIPNRRTRERTALEKSRVCFLTTGLCFWGLSCWAVTQGLRRKSTGAEKSLEANYLHKTSPSSVAFPNELCYPSR